MADFPSSNELDAANGIVSEDAAIEITRKLVVDSLKASSPIAGVLFLLLHKLYSSADCVILIMRGLELHS